MDHRPVDAAQKRLERLPKRLVANAAANLSQLPKIMVAHAAVRADKRGGLRLPLRLLLVRRPLLHILDHTAQKIADRIIAVIQAGHCPTVLCSTALAEVHLRTAFPRKLHDMDAGFFLLAIITKHNDILP